jgi:hypothetical protein
MGVLSPGPASAKIGARRENPAALFLLAQLSEWSLAAPSFESSAPHWQEVTMLYAILAYHIEAEVLSWTPEADAALMTELHRVHDRFKQAGRLGPAARLGETSKARTLRGPGSGMVIDGPFAETKEQLLGFYVLNCESEAAAIERPTICAESIRALSTKYDRSPSIFLASPCRQPGRPRLDYPCDPDR